MPKNSVSIVIPTYREAENIPVLIKKIHTALNKKFNYEAVIVDDNSGDGIDKKVEKLKKEKYNVKLKIRLNEKGLSSAVIEGIKISSGDMIVVMDADLSHPAEKIPDMLDLLVEKKADFVVGSRFVDGGSADHFSLYRKLNAWISKTLARPFTSIKDPMAGFFAFNSSISKNKINTLNPLGFKIGLEMIVKCGPKKIKEIPIIFQERLYGESKLDLKQQLLYLLHIKRLFEFKYPTLSEIIKFLVIGSCGMAVDLFMVFLSYGVIGIPFKFARVIGFLVALTTNFFLNYRFTFKNMKKEKKLYIRYAEFITVCTIGFALNWFISVSLYQNYPFFEKYYLLAATIGIIGGTFINFTGSKFIVFKTH